MHVGIPLRFSVVAGPLPRPGQLIGVDYVGRFLDGEKFDSSFDRGRPFHFHLDRREVIRAYDLAFIEQKVRPLALAVKR